MTMKEISHSGWYFIHQDHDHHKPSVDRGMATATCFRTAVVPLRRKHSHSVYDNITLGPLSIMKT